MPRPRSKIVTAVVVAVLFWAGSYAFVTTGLERFTAAEVTTSTEEPSVPTFFYAPPDTVPTTEAYGPVGPVSAVFAVPRVSTGLTATMDNPWVAVSGQTGAYRALSAPHRPEPGRDKISVAEDGRLLAWGYDDGVVFFDPVHNTSGEARGIGKSPKVGPFSPDSRYLLLQDGTLRVLDVNAGEVVATLEGVDGSAARKAVWTRDGSAVTYVRDGRFVTHEWESDWITAVPTEIPSEATLSWSSNGEQVAAMSETRGVRSVDVYDVAGDGRLEHAWLVSPDGYAQQRLLGFSGPTRVTVTALSLESGPLPLVYSMSTVDTAQPSVLTQLSGRGINWGTLEISADSLVGGSTPFDEPTWPPSDAAKLAGTFLFTAFLLALYLTRPAQRRTWRTTRRNAAAAAEKESTGV